MRLAVPAALIAFCAASPALATGGFECRPVSSAGPSLHLAVGHSVAARPLFAILGERQRPFSTQGSAPQLAIGQVWIDQRYLWLDLTDSNANRFEAKLRATFQPKLRGRPALGTLVRGGRTYRMRCVEA